jgi:hypothetical protein
MKIVSFESISFLFLKIKLSSNLIALLKSYVEIYKLWLKKLNITADDGFVCVIG